MKFSKAQKPLVIEWIDHQFESNTLFPCECAEIVDGEPHVCKSHMKAYKAWTKTPHKRSHIREWIDDWLSTAEIVALKAALKEHADGEKEAAE